MATECVIAAVQTYRLSLQARQADQTTDFLLEDGSHGRFNDQQNLTSFQQSNGNDLVDIWLGSLNGVFASL
jgi:hypothetical protein